jgi:hypothetical protein
MEHFFTNIYEQKVWGQNINNDYNGNSGGGSFLTFNQEDYIPFLKMFIINNNIKTVVDLGCGDFRCGRSIYHDLDIIYTGYDTYKKMIDSHLKYPSLSKYFFKHLDFYNRKEDIIGGDLCILKDVIQYWKIDEIYNFLDYLIESKKFKYILICNCCGQTQDNPIINDIVVNGVVTRCTELSCDFFPLKKYNPVKLLNYHTKEVSVIFVK